MYPGFSPSYRVVEQTGGFARTCLVVEVLSLEALSDPEAAMIKEQLEAGLANLLRQMGNLERIRVVTADQFDPQLRAGLRLA